MTFQERMGIPRECEMAAVVLADTYEDAVKLKMIMSCPSDTIVTIEDNDNKEYYFGFIIKSHKLEINLDVDERKGQEQNEDDCV